MRRLPITNSWAARAGNYSRIIRSGNAYYFPGQACTGKRHLKRETGCSAPRSFELSFSRQDAKWAVKALEPTPAKLPASDTTQGKDGNPLEQFSGDGCRETHSFTVSIHLFIKGLGGVLLEIPHARDTFDGIGSEVQIYVKCALPSTASDFSYSL